jgi:hypothetical protein
MKIYAQVWLSCFLFSPLLGATPSHGLAFWRSIKAHDFAVPPNESVQGLALEIVDLAGDIDPAVRDDCGYDILANWVYRRELLSADQLEAVRRKLVPGMTFHIGESGGPAIFRRSFSALYMSVIAAEDLRKPFLSDPAFHETLDGALKCYAVEKDLRGYVPVNGWAHATAHVADLIKFLGRNSKLTPADQRRIIDGIAQRCHTVQTVFVWGEDARIAAALCSVIERKDFDPSIFDPWFQSLAEENKQLWKVPALDTAVYVHVRTQANVLAQLAAKLAAKEPNQLSANFRTALNKIVAELN